jgi:hypothetical protein
MEAMPEQWTEGRLDELSSKVDRGFEQVDRRFERIDADIHALRVEMKTELTTLRSEMNEDTKGLRKEMERVNDRIDSVQRAVAFAAAAQTSAIIAGFAGICTVLAALL